MTNRPLQMCRCGLAALALACGAGPLQAAYWNVFNIEGESTLSSNIGTYAALMDMLSDTNRTGVFEPNPLGFGVNIVGSGSDGMAPGGGGGTGVPTPGSLALVLVGLLALGLRRRAR